MPIQTSVTGADGRAYRVDTYIQAVTPSSGRAGKQVTVIVRLASDTSRVLAKLTTNYDLATGCTTDTPPEPPRVQLMKADRSKAALAPAPIGGARCPSFSYSAIDAQGVGLAGEIQAADASAARDALRGNGLLAQWVEELKAPAVKGKGNRSKRGSSPSRCRCSRASSRR